MKTNLTDLYISELKQVLADCGEKTFRAKQIFRSACRGLDFNEMTDIPKTLRERLSEKYYAVSAEIIKVLKSVDGTEKFLFQLTDGNVIEGVIMKYKYGNTLCVSTQVGCRMNCAFCASGLKGLVRNLTAGEILGEVIAVNRYLGGDLKDKRKVTNIVLMGSGEPLDNYDNVVKFLRIVSDGEGLNVSPRNVSLSTCGIVPKMYDLASENLPVNLTVSLHSPFDEERKTIMPIAKSYGISEILSACSHYFDKTGRRYIFEYVLIGGVNDTERHAQALIDLLKGRPCHVNLIRLNEVKERGMKSGTEGKSNAFLDILIEAGISATLRRSMGQDIDGACGQLRQRYIEETENGE